MDRIQVDWRVEVGSGQGEERLFLMPGYSIGLNESLRQGLKVAWIFQVRSTDVGLKFQI